MTELIVVPTPSELTRPAAEWLELEMTRAIAGRGVCTVCLAGGRTPEPVYRELASASTHRLVERWRCSSATSARFRPIIPTATTSWCTGFCSPACPIPAGQVHRMEAERSDREAAAREYERSLPSQLDILVLGMGPDGHTASLFPGSAALDEHQRLVVPVIGAKPPPQRLTITPLVIEAARRVAVIATGGDKAAMVARAIEGPLSPKDVPVQLARRGTWFLDQAAAGRLTAGRVVS